MRDYVKRAIVVLVLGLLGLGVSVWAETIHSNLITDAGYASFCNVNSKIDCDVVLGSKWAELGGVSVSLLAIVYYAVLVGIAGAVVVIGDALRRRQFSDVLFMQVVGGLAFSLYMAGVALGILQTICLMCSALYVIAVLEFVAVWRLRSVLKPLGRRQAATRAKGERLVIFGGAGAIGLLLVLIAWEMLNLEATPQSGQAIRSADPKFYEWYLAQPVVSFDGSGRNERGSPTAPVTIVEFSDFECGHCNAFRNALEGVWREHRQDLRVVFRHFPLDSDCNKAVASRFHPQACLAAVAAECAGEQDRFWEYHNLLFRNQQQFDGESLLAYARQLGLNSDSFSQCLGRGDVRGRVESDARAGAELGINSTPTIIINGRMIKGALDAADLRKALVLARDGRS